jgi:glycosyltransferase involved in cell wall biosynthesis
VAVVIPCYEDGAVIGDAVASVRRQEPCEVVVVDDGSTGQRTLGVLDELEASGVRVLRQAHQGPSQARNTGVAATSAPYVFPLDADDEVYPGALTTLADALDAQPDVAVAWGYATSFGVGMAERPGHLRARKLDPWRITFLNEVPGASLIRRSSLTDVAGWRAGTGYEDWDLWMALAEAGHRGTGLDVRVQRYRVHESRRWSEAHRRHEDVMDELRRAHHPLFARRRRTWHVTTAPWRARLLLPLVDRLPVSRRSQWRVAYVLLQPRMIVNDDVRPLVRRRLRQLRRPRQRR